MKILVFLAILALSPMSIFAQVLTELPFGIVIGETKNSEIENRGVCIKQIQVRENHFRCLIYNIAGKFRVYSSQNEIVSKIEFDARYNHQLPSKWKSLGLSLQVLNAIEGGEEEGTSLDQLKKFCLINR